MFAIDGARQRSPKKRSYSTCAYYVQEKLLRGMLLFVCARTMTHCLCPCLARRETLNLHVDDHGPTQQSLPQGRLQIMVRTLLSQLFSLHNNCIPIIATTATPPVLEHEFCTNTRNKWHGATRCKRGLCCAGEREGWGSRAVAQRAPKMKVSGLY